MIALLLLIFAVWVVISPSLRDAGWGWRIAACVLLLIGAAVASFLAELRDQLKDG